MSAYEWKDEKAGQLFKEVMMSLLEASTKDNALPLAYQAAKQKIDQILSVEPDNENPRFWSYASQTYSQLAMKDVDNALARSAATYGARALMLHETKDQLKGAELYLLYKSMTISHYILDNTAEALTFCKKALALYPEDEMMTEFLQTLQSGSGTASSGQQSQTTGKKGCFIITAICPFPASRELFVFRQFRDEYLIPYKLGRSFVESYYRWSPPLADFISRQPKTKKLLYQLIIKPIAYALDKMFLRTM